MTKTVIIHKMVHDKSGAQQCMCPTSGSTMLAFQWKRVNCVLCRKYRGMKFSAKQMREIIRARKERNANPD